MTKRNRIRGEPQQDAGQAADGLGHGLGVVVLVGGLDLLDLLVHLAVDVENGIRGLKVDLDGGLGGVGSQDEIDGHDHADIVPGVDAAAHHKAVETGKHGDETDIGGDQKMQHADALVAVHPQLAETAVHHGDLHALLIEVAGVVAGGHDERNELGKGGQGTEKPAVLPVAEAAPVACFHVVSCSFSDVFIF